MNLVFILIGVSICGAFAVAAMARFRRIANALDAFVMTAVTAIVIPAAFAPDWIATWVQPLADWPGGAPPAELQLAAASAVVTSVFAIRTAIVGEANLLFGTIGVWGHVALIAVSPQILTTFLVLQMASWLAWFEVSRRDSSPKAMAGTRWLLWTVAADLPFAFAIVHISGRVGSVTWTTLQSLTQYVTTAGANDPTIAMLVVSLVASAAARFALYPFASWQSRVVETSRVGRGFAQAMLAIPVGLILLERATELWRLSPVAQLLVLNWGPLATLAAAIIALGPRRSSTLLAAAVTASLGMITYSAALGGPACWPAVVLAAAAVRPAWSRTSQAVCSIGFLLLFLMAAEPIVRFSSANVEAAATPQAWLFEVAAVAALMIAGRATALGRETTGTTDEQTHPRWPGLMYLAAAFVVVIREDAFAGFGSLLTSEPERTIVAVVAFGMGLFSTRLWPLADDATESRFTIVRLARRYFYIDEIVAFGLVLPVRAAAQLTRLLDSFVTRSSLVGLFGGTMRHLDRETRHVEADDPPVVVGMVVAILAIAALVIAGAS